MASTVFLSHAGADAARAAAVADLLTAAGIQTRFDRRELSLGDSFLAFMESALSDSDYCLLLWSRQAAATQWVKLEWEAALYRSVQEKRSFLVVGRLEELNVPALLGPRLRVDLFPEWQPGLGQIVETWQADREAEARTQRPVASSPLQPAAASPNATIYVTSDQFGITVPLKANVDEPAGVYLDSLVSGFRLPKVFDYEGRVGMRFAYRLMNGKEALDRALPLAAQGVRDKSVLWLETTITPYSQSDPVAGALSPAVFRSLDLESPAGDMESLAKRALLGAVRRSGLGPSR